MSLNLGLDEEQYLEDCIRTFKDFLAVFDSGCLKGFGMHHNIRKTMVSSFNLYLRANGLKGADKEIQ